MPYPFHDVPEARHPQIDNRQLDNLRQVALDAQRGVADPGRLDWLVFCTAALLDELAQRRAWMAGNAPYALLKNVIELRSEVR